MDAFAALQLKKKKKRLEEESQRNKDLNNINPIKNDEVAILKEQEKIIAYNILIGYPLPPGKVFAIAKDHQAAAVWWTYEHDVNHLPSQKSNMDDKDSAKNDVVKEFQNDDENDDKTKTLSGWRIERYKRDKSKKNEVWLHKGYSDYPLIERLQVVVDGLSNESEYKFRIRAINSKRCSEESPYSNAVYIESPLPPGWLRFFDTKNGKYYYANTKTRESSWTRPELNPFFLDQTIVLNFRSDEIKYLKKLYLEEIAHFECVSVDRFMDVLREVGERCSKRWIASLFRGYGGNNEKLLTWTHYMEVMNHIKGYRMHSATPLSNLFGSMITWFRRNRVKMLLHPSRNKLGDWTIEFSALANRKYYKNGLTGETSWSMPDGVKFFLPAALEKKLLKLFDFGQIEEFKQFFSLLDVDGSGDLSAAEVKILLEELDIYLADDTYRRLYRAIDLNGNGTLEFDEFCWLMHEIYRRDSEFTDHLKSVRRGRVGCWVSDEEEGGTREEDLGAEYAKKKSSDTMELLNQNLLNSEMKSKLNRIMQHRRDAFQQESAMNLTSSPLASSNGISGSVRGSSVIGLKVGSFSSSSPTASPKNAQSSPLNQPQTASSLSFDRTESYHYATPSPIKVSTLKRSNSIHPTDSNEAIPATDDYLDDEDHGKFCMCGCRRY